MRREGADGAVLDECAEHIAREYSKAMVLRSLRSSKAPASVSWPLPAWENLPEESRELAIATMRSLLYRGVILCPLPEHRIGIDLRDSETEAPAPVFVPPVVPAAGSGGKHERDGHARWRPARRGPREGGS